MKRNIRIAEKLLLLGYSFILLFMIVQDWVPIGTLNDVHAISDTRSKSELILVTLFGIVQILILMFIILKFIGRRYSIWAKLWLIIHPTIIFIGALLEWWIPYFFGYGADKRSAQYAEMFGNTHSFLPAMNGIVPNTLHSMFHAILLLCIILTVYINFTSNR